MNFSKQLKKYRELKGYSQEVLAEKIYVTRQTISKWENDKTYPDIHNLVALSILFEISLDELVKGDMMTMKNIVAKEKMDRDTKGMLLFLFLVLIIGVPSIMIFGIKGYIPFGILWAIAMYFAIKIEIAKKKYNVKTFKEIIAFSEGDLNLEELQRKRNNKSYFKEKILIVFTFTLIFGILALIISFVTDLFLKL
ncbi:helix-turn-helix domain-containing protein [Vagococcus intermedius]|uniref:Helix-turn-helix domain-containing protein n=1 Tax=Vagococcus intermedius TaxID=2991418 RepID=A0AAF0CX24_9ENTE|nr:helix-turn-helix transcriptional regulator [Vagococcus intermedius]WEG74373.1 helix-turn-helix domain-containing protein [Vagococcus intermedius]WEG76495.1 helix-turn-helix domain-containing protein [Vagococcus intermedius]